MIFVSEGSNCNCSRDEIRRIATQIVNSKIEYQREEIFRSIKDYMKYDSDLNVFSKMANEKFTNEFEKICNDKLSSSTNSINKIIDTKMDDLIKKEPISLISEQIKKDLQPTINKLDATSLLTIANFALLGFLISRR